MSILYSIQMSQGLVWVKATSERNANSIAETAFPNNPIIGNSTGDAFGDTSLLFNTPGLIAYKLIGFSGKIYYVSGSNLDDCYTRLYTSFPSEGIIKNAIKLGGDFSLISDPTPPTPPIRLATAINHWGQNNNLDYNSGNIALGVDLYNKLNFNCAKSDLSMNGSGVVSSPNYAAYVSAFTAITPRPQMWGVITTQNKRGSGTNPIPEPLGGGGTTYTNAQLLSNYNSGHTKAAGFMSLNAGVYQIIEVGNENDAKCIITSPPAAGNVWNSANYNLETYKMIAAEMMGIFDAIKSADSTVRMCVNWTWYHGGGFGLQVAKDWKTTPSYLTAAGIPNLVRHWDSAQLHWYSDMEYGTAPTGGSATGQAMNQVYHYVSDWYDKIGVSEMGLRLEAIHPNYNKFNMTKEDYIIQQLNLYYFAASPALVADNWVIYELLLEPHRTQDYEQKYGLQDGTVSGPPYTYSSAVNKLSTINY